MPLPTLRWLILALLCLSTVINYVDRQTLAVVLPSLRQDLGLSSVDYGTITTLFLIAYTLAQVASGVFIDRIGTRKGFAWFVGVWSLAAVAHAFATGPWSLGALRFLLGLGESGNWPAGGKAIAEWFPKSRRAFAMGVFDGGSAIGAILAPPIVAGLALAFGWRSAFVVTGLAGFVWLAAWWWIYHRPAEHPWLQEKLDTEPEARSARPSLRSLLGERKLWGLMLTRMVATPVWWFYVFWLPDYLNKEHGFTLKEIGLFGWIPFLTVDLGKLIGGGVSDRLLQRGYSATLARKSVMFAGALAMSGGLRVVGADSAASAIAWVSLATFGFGLWSANILALHADLFPRSAMATAIGWTGTAASGGGALFTYVVGWLVQGSGYESVFWIVGTLALFACLSLLFVIGRVEAVRLSEAAA
ncbi:MAG: MFS transporter [Bryobacteraceae bacterium]|nr:MFS transporter [Bryobacteraceae bacterium]